MEDFVGCVILESLSDPAVISGWAARVERAFDMPRDPDAAVWHVRWYVLDETTLRQALPRLADAMLPHWYAHFFRGDELCVVLSKKSFWARCGDKATWSEFIAYGDTVGVERRWTERIPTAPPPYAAGALGKL